MRKRDRGFSLLEVLGVLGVVMLTLGFVLPSVNRGIQEYRLTASAQEVASQIQSARYRALRNNTMSTFLVMPTAGGFGIDVDADGDIEAGTTDVVASLERQVSFANLATPPPGTLANVAVLSTGSLTGIAFTPRGTLTTVNSSGVPVYTSTGTTGFAQAGFIVYLSNPNGSEFAAVTVSPVGRVRTWTSGDGTVWQ